MITELVLLIPLLLLYKFKLLNLRYIILIILVLYWLPKPLIRLITPASVLIEN